MLATVLFTDIVESTARALELGDRRWRDLLERHDDAGPPRAVAISRPGGRRTPATASSRPSTVPRGRSAARGRSSTARRTSACRSGPGLHAGECELTSGNLAGIAVHTGARIVGRPAPARCSSRARSAIWSPGPGSRSATGACMSSRGCRDAGSCTTCRPRPRDKAAGLRSPVSGLRRRRLARQRSVDHRPGLGLPAGAAGLRPCGRWVVVRKAAGNEGDARLAGGADLPERRRRRIRMRAPAPRRKQRPKQPACAATWDVRLRQEGERPTPTRTGRRVGRLRAPRDPRGTARPTTPCRHGRSPIPTDALTGDGAANSYPLGRLAGRCGCPSPRARRWPPRWGWPRRHAGRRHRRCQPVRRVGPARRGHCADCAAELRIAGQPGAGLQPARELVAEAGVARASSARCRTSRRHGGCRSRSRHRAAQLDVPVGRRRRRRRCTTTGRSRPRSSCRCR